MIKLKLSLVIVRHPEHPAIIQTMPRYCILSQVVWRRTRTAYKSQGSGLWWGKLGIYDQYYLTFLLVANVLDRGQSCWSLISLVRAGQPGCVAWGEQFQYFSCSALACYDNEHCRASSIIKSPGGSLHFFMWSLLRSTDRQAGRPDIIFTALSGLLDN